VSHVDKKEDSIANSTVHTLFNIIFPELKGFTMISTAAGVEFSLDDGQVSKQRPSQH
jgi:hypothetical protein